MVTRSAGKSHRVVFTKSALAEQAVPAARVLADARIVSHVAFGELVLWGRRCGPCPLLWALIGADTSLARASQQSS